MVLMAVLPCCPISYECLECLDSPVRQGFYNPSPLNICPNMKKITIEKVLWSLEDMQYEITLPQEMIEKARAAIEGMIAL